MSDFYCSGKKGVCNEAACSESCEFYDGTGGKYVEKPKTELERIQTMGKKELGEFLCSLMNADDCYTRCPAKDYCYHGHNGMEKYLSGPARED